MSLVETRDALKAILGDADAFEQVLDTVFENMDENKDGGLSVRELEMFIMGVCGDMGVKESPNGEQVGHVFKHLDLNSDNEVSKEELSVFLRHLFNEQLKHTEEKLKKEEQKAAASSK